MTTIAYGAPPGFADPFHVKTARQRAASFGTPIEDRQAVEQRTNQPAPTIINELHNEYRIDLGVIAAVGGVSRNALRKWRDGTARPDRSRWGRLIRLAVLCEALGADRLDPAVWLARPLDADPILRFVDLARIDRFDLLGQLRHGIIRPSDAYTAAFPNRGHRPGVDVKAQVDLDGVLLEIPALDLFAEGATVVEAENGLLGVLQSFLAVATDEELGELRWLRRYSGERLRQAVLGR